MIRYIGGALIVACAALGSACSSDDSGGSGVSSSKKVNELTNDEAKKLCKAHQSDFDGLASGGCKFGAVSASPDKATCETAVGQCEAVVSGGDAGAGGVDCDGTDVSQVSNCTLTVGELESCLDQLSSIFASASCDDVGKAPSMPACANDIRTKCVGLTGG